MTKNELLNLIVANSEQHQDKLRLSCKKAHELAAKHKVELAEIGRICNEKNIKIFSCELLCF